MVEILDPTPDPDVAKRISCRECGARLSYVPRDVKTYQYSAMGETGTAYYVDCPNCGGNAVIRT